MLALACVCNRSAFARVTRLTAAFQNEGWTMMVQRKVVSRLRGAAMFDFDAYSGYLALQVSKCVRVSQHLSLSLSLSVCVCVCSSASTTTIRLMPSTRPAYNSPNECHPAVRALSHHRLSHLFTPPGFPLLQLLFPSAAPSPLLPLLLPLLHTPPDMPVPGPDHTPSS